ncbi:MAG TPA: patatin-like phospholipase family protein [Acidimicrobiales bacterium]|nr:patatin-like phospholipase family protein [Acidimicrobiales bacterium]
MPDAETPPGTEPEPESDDPPAEPVGTGDDRELGDVEPAPAKLTREQAREQAEAERIERELQAQREALELARADAERQLAGPGLISPDPPLPPTDLEALWAPEVTRSLHHLREDLESHRVGLAISGGGALGSFEAGALRFLYDHTRVDPVAICGNSAGALNAAKLAEGEHGGARPIDEVERIWRSLRINSDMWEPEPWLVRLQASASWAATLRDQVSDSDSAASAVRVAVRVVGSLVRRPPETDGTIDAIRESLRAQSLLSLAPIATLVERELQPERVRASGIALRMGTVSLEAGELRYVTETGELVDRHDRSIGQPAVELAEGVLASASIPLAFPPVVLNDEHYVDGGAREILPLELLVEHMGVQRVVAVSASSATIKRAPSFADRNMLDILRRVSAEIGPNETLRKELDPPGGWRPEVRLVVPRFNVHDSMTIDPALIAISLDHGYLRAADVLLRLGPEASDLTERITRIRVQLRHLSGPVPTIFDTTLGRDRLQLAEPADRGPDDPDEVGEAGGARTDERGTGRDQEEPVDDDEPDDSAAQRAAESMVRSARAFTASGRAVLAKVMTRDEQPDDDDERVAGRPDDAQPEDAQPEDAQPEDAQSTDGSVPAGDGTPGPQREGGDRRARAGGGADVAPVTPAEAVERAAEVPLAEAEETAARSAARQARRAAEARAEAEAREVVQLTAELRDLVERRLALGLPFPATLVAWLRGS